MNAILGLLKLLQTPISRAPDRLRGQDRRRHVPCWALLNDILDFSKVETGRTTLDPREFTVDKLLRDLS